MSFFVGAALIAALVDIPIFARITVAEGSQIKAALVLLEFLVALPVGALVGGVLTRRLPAGILAAVGHDPRRRRFLADGRLGPGVAGAPVVLGRAGRRPGFGFGLALAPVNAALLASTADSVHGVTSALLVVSRMVGMLVGISALTTIGLRRYYAVEADIPSPNEVCGGEDPLRGVHPADRAGRHRAAAGDLPRRRHLRRRRRGRGRALLPRRPHPGPCPPTGPARHRLGFVPVATIFDDLLAANRKFAETFDLAGFDGVAHAGIAIVTCMDSRIAPLRMLGLDPGDAKIFRNPGGRVTPQALEALVLGVHLLQVERILVVPHTRCAMASATLEELRARVGESAGQDASWQPFDVVDGPAGRAPRRRPAGARPSPDPRDSVAVGGFLYDVDTGLIDQLV